MFISIELPLCFCNYRKTWQLCEIIKYMKMLTIAPHKSRRRWYATRLSLMLSKLLLISFRKCVLFLYSPFHTGLRISLFIVRVSYYKNIGIGMSLLFYPSCAIVLLFSVVLCLLSYGTLQIARPKTGKILVR